MLRRAYAPGDLALAIRSKEVTRTGSFQDPEDRVNLSLHLLATPRLFARSDLSFRGVGFTL